MLVQKYRDMLSGKSVIRQLSEFATARGQEIGYENVFDYSLGNPSVPVPGEFTEELMRLLSQGDSCGLHGYSPSLGITSVREAVAAHLEERWGLPYRKEHIFMASGRRERWHMPSGWWPGQGMRLSPSPRFFPSTVPMWS